jgi:CHAT domain-containing protein
MTKFYENLSSGHSKAGALRTAALATRSQTDNERFHRWAAFILTGAWD